MDKHLKKVLLIMIILSTFVIVQVFSIAESDFSGKWTTTFGEMNLKQKENKIWGYYISGSLPNQIQGTVKEGRFEFEYNENGSTGTGWFGLSDDGNSFEGKWKEDGSNSTFNWKGDREKVIDNSNFDFSGLWTSAFGKLRIIRTGDQFHGVYLYKKKPSILQGKMNADRLEFSYTEEKTSGTGWFELSNDKQSFIGKWKEKEKKELKDWNGTRQNPVPGQYWLVILEARWEDSMTEVEYSYGKMLRSFFARSPKIKVRHRFFDDNESLRKWCFEAAFLPEPVLLVIATHGLAEGLQVDGQSIDERMLADNLRFSENIMLLHFSSCLILKGDFAKNMLKRIVKKNRFPVSGYTTSVDWAASVNIEFMYFDLMLNRDYAPDEAARDLLKILPFSGNEVIKDLPFEPAGFRYLDPEFIE